MQHSESTASTSSSQPESNSAKPTLTSSPIPSRFSSPQLYRSRRTPPSGSRQTSQRKDPRTARRLSFGSGGGSRDNEQGGGGGDFTFAPVPPFNLKSLQDSLKATEAEGDEPRAASRAESGDRRIAGLPQTKNAKSKTGIMDLPDELLLKIFANLNDEQGFRPVSPMEWYSPPLRIALVCKRWLPVSQSLFYRSIRIHHLSRISLLHRTFAATSLSLAVRHLTINLPYTALSGLSLPISSLQAVSRTLPREADSDSDSSQVRRKDKKTRDPLTAQDQLRGLFQSCSQLLSLEISGIDPRLLFSSFTTSSSLQHLHHLRLSTVSKLSLKGGFESPVLTSMVLRNALLALTGLRSLALTGYVSDFALPLDFAPTRTNGGSPARPLPMRARALLKIKRIVVVESAMSSNDLETLLRQMQRGSVEELVIQDSYDGKLAEARRREGKYAGTTIEGLSEKRVGELVKGSLRLLKVTLHNYPLARDALSAAQTSSPPPPPRRPLPGQPAPRDPAHILDRFVSTCETLQVLDLGGSLVTSSLLLPSSSHSSAESPLLPSTVRHLTIRACPSLTPTVVLSFLDYLKRERQTLHSSTAPNRRFDSHPFRLSTLSVFGGSESGWKNPVKAWEVQKACWDSGVVWQGGGGGQSREIDGKGW